MPNGTEFASYVGIFLEAGPLWVPQQQTVQTPADGIMDNESPRPQCPFCQSPMIAAYFIIGGGVWFCESKEFLEYVVAGRIDQDGARMQQINRQQPMHTIIGSSGYREGHGTWPKEGLYCDRCGVFAVKAKPY